MYQGAHLSGGSCPDDKSNAIYILFAELLNYIKEDFHKKENIRRAMVRSLVPTSYIFLLDKLNLFILGDGRGNLGMPSMLYLYEPEKHFSYEQALEKARWDIGMQDVFCIKIPVEFLTLNSESRENSLRVTATEHVDAEFRRAQKMFQLIQISPIFGPASYSIDENLVFVLMPFEDELTDIYSSFIKPQVEAVNLICKRADDFQTNKIIMQDIWKAICEARIIIADLTSQNPNVMYELGIAHVVGKETIIINQKSEKNIKFPFDLAHIRRIEYENTAIGGKKLAQDLSTRLESLEGIAKL